jgi:hypothetical protein
MAEIIKTSQTILVIGCIFAVLGVFIERWLIRTGLMLDRTGWVIFTAFSGVIMHQVFLQQVSWWIFAPAILLGMTIGVHRGDLWMTMQRGRWWWKAEE